MARMERYFVWASASSGLNSVASGVPRLTVAPNSTCTLVTMPPTSETTFTSRYASAVTVPGSCTVTSDTAASAGAVLIPARLAASGDSTTSAGTSGVLTTGDTDIGAVGEDGGALATGARGTPSR